MSAPTYLLLFLAALAMLLSYVTRVEARGEYPLLGHRPMWRELLNFLNLPCTIALVVWAFQVYPWQWALGGVLFFVVVLAIVQGFVIALLGGIGPMQVLSRIRPVLDVALAVGTAALWWEHNPL